MGVVVGLDGRRKCGFMRGRRMIKITQLKIPLEGGYEDILSAAAKALKCPKRAITSLEISKKAVDCRKKEVISLFIMWRLRLTAMKTLCYK